MTYQETADAKRPRSHDIVSLPTCAMCQAATHALAKSYCALQPLLPSVPHVGTEYGKDDWALRLVLVGLEDPYHAASPTAYLEAAKSPEYFLRRGPGEGRNPHRAGEWVFAQAVLGLPMERNPFPYIATVNGHICGLKKGSTGTGSTRLPRCQPAWNIVAALEPHVVVVEGRTQQHHARDGLREAGWACAPLLDMSVRIPEYRDRWGELAAMEAGASYGQVAVLFAFHPSNRRMPWYSREKQHPYVTMLGEKALELLAKHVIRRP